MSEVQTRDEDGALKFFPSVLAAARHAETDPKIWKISFNSEDGNRVRLVRNETGHWILTVANERGNFEEFPPEPSANETSDGSPARDRQ